MPLLLDLRLVPAGRRYRRITDAAFGRRTADYNDGDMFETRVGTSNVTQNIFYMPEALEREFVASGDPEGALLRRAHRESREKAAVRADTAVEKERVEKLEAAVRGSAVVFVGRIPSGFYEEAQFQFFSQYGKVTRLRLSRDKASNKYRGYGWVEFEDAKVAHQVCKEMNGYILYGKRLRVHMVRHDKLHPQLFRNCHREFVPVNWRKVARERAERHERAKAADPKKEIKYLGKLIKKEEARNKRIKRTKLAGQTLMSLGWELDLDLINIYKERIAVLKTEKAQRAKRKAARAMAALTRASRTSASASGEASLKALKTGVGSVLGKQGADSERQELKGAKKTRPAKVKGGVAVKLEPTLQLAAKVARDSGHLI